MPTHLPARWLAEVPARQIEPLFGDRRVACFAERPRSLWAMVEAACARAGDGEALVDGERRWTWRAIARSAGVVAAGLYARGIVRGDRVLLLLRNRTEFVLASLALARLGAIAVPVSVRSAPPEVAYVAAQCGASGAICEDDLVGHLPPVDEASTLRVRVSLSGVAGTEGFSSLVGTAPSVQPVHEEDTAVILYTSGTTGRPKGAMLAHVNIVHSAMHYETCMALGACDRSLVAVPLSHVTGLVAQLWAMARCAGALVLMDTFKAADCLALAARERITHTVMVPAMYQLCLMQGGLDQHDLSAWRIGAYGGAPMAPATIGALAEALPDLRLMNAYGATETSSPATLLPPDLAATRSDSVGMAVPCGELCVVDPEGRPLPPGTIGEVWIRGPMVVRGYWDNPSATAQAFTDGWWHSGDLGRLDEQGFLQVLDRVKDVINRGGYKVFSSEVEAVLAQHPAVAESAIVGYACPVLGERVHAFVSLRPRADTDADALRAFCAERLSDYKVPERWTLGHDPLPRNANGKLMKRALRERA
ncbi:MAG: acyl--CoA ligase [Rubrivivax sp.]|nr:acyl--CoA ligase [Rubrivivax sp.]